MLITRLKDKKAVTDAAKGKIFIVSCHGCREIYFPEDEAKELASEWKREGKVTDVLVTDYICNPENINLQLERYKDKIDTADTVMVFSCGVGVQTVAERLAKKRVCAGCDTYPLPGFEGLTPLENDCDQCGECYLNLTGGICPITACSKGLLNGPCGGVKNGRCEVDSDMECGWERIYSRLERIGRLDALKSTVQVRNFEEV